MRKKREKKKNRQSKNEKKETKKKENTCDDSTLFYSFSRFASARKEKGRGGGEQEILRERKDKWRERNRVNMGWVEKDEDDEGEKETE